MPGGWLEREVIRHTLTFTYRAEAARTLVRIQRLSSAQQANDEPRTWVVARKEPGRVTRAL